MSMQIGFLLFPRVNEQSYRSMLEIAADLPGMPFYYRGEITGEIFSAWVTKRGVMVKVDLNDRGTRLLLSNP